MKSHKVNCTKQMSHAGQAWEHIRDFGSNWHPDIVSCRTETDASGAVVRVFTGTDGGTYREQVTYFSDSDRVLRYALTEGIPGIANYRAEAHVLQDAVNWTATFDASEDRGEAVAQGTSAIFNNGLEWLAHNSTAVETTTPPDLKGKAKLHRLRIDGAARLSVLSALPVDEPCWTLVLFLHGIGGNAGNWQSQLEALAQSHSVAALDLRGYGDSQTGSQQTRIDDYCDDIIGVMKKFGARKLVLVGLSMGSWIATSFAMRYPQLLAGLVLAGGCTGMSEADTEERTSFQQARAVPLAEGKTPAEFADAVVQLIAGPAATAKQRAELHASMSAISSDTYLDALHCFCNPVERFDFSRIDCPVLFLTGEHDRLASPEEIRQISLRTHTAVYNAGKLPNVRFEVISDAGHLCNVEQPGLFNRQLVEFLNKTPGTAISQAFSRESRRQLKSRRILDAALAEFSAQGFDGVSMAAIAKRAGVSKPTLYQYFGDKDGLFATMLQECCEHIITPLSAPDGTLVDRLWNFSWTYAEFVLREDMLSLARLVLGEAARKPEVAGIYHEAGPGKAFDGLLLFIRECVEAGQLEVDDIEYAAQHLWSLILSGPRDHYLHFVNERPDTTILLRSIGHGLQAFLKIYSTHRDTDLQAVLLKISTMESVSGDKRLDDRQRWTEA